MRTEAGRQHAAAMAAPSSAQLQRGSCNPLLNCVMRRGRGAELRRAVRGKGEARAPAPMRRSAALGCAGSAPRAWPGAFRAHPLAAFFQRRTSKVHKGSLLSVSKQRRSLSSLVLVCLVTTSTANPRPAAYRRECRSPSAVVLARAVPSSARAFPASMRGSAGRRPSFLSEGYTGLPRQSSSSCCLARSSSPPSLPASWRSGSAAGEDVRGKTAWLGHRVCARGQRALRGRCGSPRAAPELSALPLRCLASARASGLCQPACAVPLSAAAPPLPAPACAALAVAPPARHPASAGPAPTPGASPARRRRRLPAPRPPFLSPTPGSLFVLLHHLYPRSRHAAPHTHTPSHHHTSSPWPRPQTT